VAQVSIQQGDWNTLIARLEVLESDVAELKTGKVNGNSRKRDEPDQIGKDIVEFLTKIAPIKMPPAAVERNLGIKACAGRLRWLAGHGYVQAVEEKGKNPLYFVPEEESVMLPPQHKPAPSEKDF
jgi:hypothetical protein